MAFEATKREWSELFILFKLLADGKIGKGTSLGQPDGSLLQRVCAISRLEQRGVRHYKKEDDKIVIYRSDFPIKENVSIEETEKIATVRREDFSKMIPLILSVLRQEGERVESPEELELFLDKISLYDLRSLSQEVSNMEIRFADQGEGPVGCAVWSRFSHTTRVLDGGRAANLKWEQSGAKFASPEVANINAVETRNKVRDRMLLLGQLGGVLKYCEPADRVFRANLAMIDLHLGRLLGEMVRVMHLEDLAKICDLTRRIKEINPLKVKTELIEKHHYYEWKIKQLLMASVLGMRPTKIYTGVEQVPGYFLLLNGDGNLCYFPAADRNLCAEFLFNNTRLEKTEPQKDRYGVLERENGRYYFKLNLKIGFTKR